MITYLQAKDRCVFDFLPYDTFDKYNMNYIVDSIHSTTFTNFEIEWDDRSYLKKKDILLILGKGHESYQIVNDTKKHFDDCEEALRYIKK